MDYQNEYIKKNPLLHFEQSETKAKQILSFLGDIQVNSLLDVACGAGKITAVLAHTLHSQKTVGIDISKTMIKMAKKCNTTKTISWINIDIFNYRPKQQFDLITCIDILEHVSADLAFLRKVKTLGRQILIKVPLEDSFFDNKILRKLKIRDPWKESGIKYGHIHHYNENQLIRLFSRAGLKRVKEGYIPLPKRSLLFYEIFRVIFLPIGWFSQKAMTNFVGGFKIVLLEKDEASHN